MLNEQQFYLFGQIRTSQKGGQPYIYTSPDGECSLYDTHSIFLFRVINYDFNMFIIMDTDVRV